MDWDVIITSILAGGLAGQIITLLGNNHFTNKREFAKWRLEQRHKAIIEILDTLTSNPKDGELQQWTHKIRSASLKIHILYKDGKAPLPINNSLESVFRLAQTKKQNAQTDNWDEDFRVAVSKLRQELATHINSN
ncbi:MULTISPECIES: hypothetical protein [Pseudoalteromonas]|uniref:hypothetical protein n=1 Tax=Pseudoalteromonas TaxID=53246 RepID=UPI00384D26DA